MNLEKEQMPWCEATGSTHLGPHILVGWTCGISMHLFSRLRRLLTDPLWRLVSMLRRDYRNVNPEIIWSRFPTLTEADFLSELISPGCLGTLQSSPFMVVFVSGRIYMTLDLQSSTLIETDKFSEAYSYCSFHTDSSLRRPLLQLRPWESIHTDVDDFKWTGQFCR